MGTRAAEQPLLGGKVVLRPDDDGGFDELLMYHEGDCIVHAEMMDDNSLWIGFYPPGEDNQRVCMWVNAHGRLTITAEED